MSIRSQARRFKKIRKRMKIKEKKRMDKALEEITYIFDTMFNNIGKEMAKEENETEVSI